MFRFFANRNHYSFADIGLRCDVHSHILPGVDDGAGEFADSVAILRAMHAKGVERFILTPHVSTMFPNKAAELRLRFDHLVATLPEDLAGKISLHLASEYMMDEYFDSLTDLLHYSNQHILVEMSYGVRSSGLLETIFRLVQDGFTPVLAHPERYIFYFGGKKRPRGVEELEQLQEMGCKFQLNIQSLSGAYGPDSLANLKYFLDHDWYSFVASDIHAARQMARYSDFQVSPAQFEKVRELAQNNEMLF